MSPSILGPLLPLLLIGSLFGADDQEMQELIGMSLDELLDVVVVSGTRSEAKLSESPIPISVITSADIANSGLTSLPDVLARLVEIDVLPIGRSQTEVSVRGKGINFNRRLLVLIDGRSEYNDLFGVTLWDSMPISLSDIERIEVVRGPASALFGANAFSGVINIITKVAGSGDSGVSLAGGTHQTSMAQARYTTTIDKFQFKVTAGRDRANSYESEVPFEGFNGYTTTMNLYPDDEDSLAIDRGMVQARYQGVVDVKLSAGISDGTQELFPQPGLPRAPWDLTTSNIHLSADYVVKDTGTFQFNAYQNRFKYATALAPSSAEVLALDDFDARRYWPSLAQPRIFGSKADTKDVSLQWVGSSLKHVSYVVGAESRDIQNTGSTGADSGLVRDHSKNIKSAFANAAMKLLGDTLQLGLGYRYDDDSITGGDYGYNAAINYLPTPKHSFRISSRRAFRAPSLFEQFSAVTLNVPAQFHSVRFVGNPDLENETIESLDFTYQGTIGSKFQVTFEVFQEQYEKLIGNPDSGLLEDIEFDDVTQQFTTTTTFRNLADAENEGAQVSLIYRPLENLQFNLGYARLKPDGLNDLSGEVFFSPKNKVNLSASWKYQGLSVYLEDRYVGKTDEDELIQAEFTRTHQTSYNLLNLALQFRFKKFEQLALTLNASNLLDDNYVAYYEDDPILKGVGEEFGREIYGGIQWRFK